MAYDYVIELTEITLSSGTENIGTLTFDVSDGGSAVTGLESAFKLAKTDNTDITNTAVAGSDNLWIVTLTGVTVARTELLYAYVDESGTIKSDKCLIDFSQTVASSAVDYDYVLPAQAGTYEFNFDILNAPGFTAESTNIDLDVRSVIPDSTSELSLKSGKTYLTHFTGETIVLSIDVMNSSAYAPGTYEIAVKSEVE